VELVRRRLVDRHRDRAGRGIGAPAGMKGKRLGTRIGKIGHCCSSH
jgi:hypothetical protein